MGAIFVLLGATIFVLGFRTYRDIVSELTAEEVETTSAWYAGVLTLSLTIAAALAPIPIFV